ncbi:MAG: hypothetical protein Q7J56_01205, partial [Deltaproteobacteria bacterium]|nr:hypothetical protein [Deltaproteobacteria bacterium]
MRFRTFFFALIFVVGSLALPLAAHAGIPFFGPIIPNAVVQYEDPVTHKTITTTENVCAAGWGMVITVVNNIIALLITLAIVFVAPLMIAWSGFLFVVNPVDPSGIAKAKSILTNTIVG